MRLDKNGVIISDDDDVVVNRTEPQLDECRSLLLHIVKQAVDDYESYRTKTKEEHQEIWRSANAFIFDDEHYIQWGDKEINLDQICDLIGLDIDWVRNRISQRLELKLEKDGVLVATRKF